MFKMVNAASGLQAVLKSALADGALGMTLRTGEPPIIYTSKGRRTVEGICPTQEDVDCLLKQLMTSREVRQLREHDVVHFMHTFEGRVKLLGGAKVEQNDIQVELRRVV